MACTVADVRAQDPTGLFNCIADELVQGQVDCAKLFISDSVWGDKATIGCALAAAHFLAVALKGASAPAGPVTASADGRLSRSYSAPTGVFSNSSFSSTTFGLKYLELCATITVTPFVSSMRL